MSVEITVPQLGESIVEATVGQWLKREGDSVEAGETVVSLETDKVNMEVAAPQTGVLQGIRKREGDTVTIGEALATIAEPMASGAAPAAPSSANGRAKTRTAEVSAEKAAPIATQTVMSRHRRLRWHGASPASMALICPWRREQAPAAVSRRTMWPGSWRPAQRRRHPPAMGSASPRPARRQPRPRQPDRRPALSQC